MLSRFHLIPERYGQTDGRTDGRTDRRTELLYQCRASVCWRAIKSRIWSIERRHFEWPWTNSTPSFKVTPFFDAEYLRNGTRYIHSFNEILIRTNTRPTQQCYFERPWLILGDLAKYSMTWSASRDLCDSWASCDVLYVSEQWAVTVTKLLRFLPRDAYA